MKILCIIFEIFLQNLNSFKPQRLFFVLIGISNSHLAAVASVQFMIFGNILKIFY